MESFIKLNKLDHKPIVWTGNSSFLLDETFSLFIVIAIGENQISNNKSDWSGNTLDAMNKYVSTITEGIVDKVDNSIKQTLNILILRILEEKSKVVVFWDWRIILTSDWLKPVQAVISCTVYDIGNFIFFECLLVFSDDFPGKV